MPAILLVPFASPSSTPNPSALALANMPIYSIYISSIRAIFETYMQLSGIKLTSRVYLQPLSIKFLLAAYILPGIRHTFIAYMQSLKLILITYM